MTTGTPEQQRELVAVLVALAGARRGDAAAVVGGLAGAADRVRAAIAAACGTGPAESDLDILVADVPVADVPVADIAVADIAVADIAGPADALRRLRPGGRLVALAADRDEVAVAVRRYRLALQHVEPVAGRVAWSARTPS